MKEWPLRGEVFIGLKSLPLLHQDPFDRLLVATAFTEPMRLLTAGRRIGIYDVGRNLIVMIGSRSHFPRFLLAYLGS